jgi:hypothetical protein
VTKPFIHLNGTSAEELRDAYVAALHAVNAAYEAVQKCSPNGRDYYPVPGSLDSAIEEHRTRLQALHAISEELLALAVHCDGFAK